VIIDNVSLIKNNINGIKVLPHDVSINNALNNIDVLITSHSTVGTDALYKHIPIIIFDPYTQPENNFYVSNQIGSHARDKIELEKIIKKIIKDESFKNKKIELQNLVLNNFMAYSGYESHKKVVHNIKGHIRKHTNA